MTDFTTFGLPAKLLQALARMQFTTPTPIQAQAIPLVLAGRDILGSAETGTGKTGAFGIPVMAKLMENPQAFVLVLTPTRELATQVRATLQQLIPIQEIKTALLIGGESLPKQFQQLTQRPQIVVGTPGRVNDHLQRGTLKLNNTKFLILDETDRMLDMGFGVQIDRIVQNLPKDRQTLMFSATMPADIVRLSAKYLRDPERIAIGSTIKPTARIKQEMIQTTVIEKHQRLLQELDQRSGSIIVFVKTKHGSKRLAEKLNSADYKADAIHGNLQQNKRDKVIQNFRDKKYRILVATDVAARGLDIPHIEHVINYDLPQCPEDYIHRIGRTGRAGAEGSAINLVTPDDQAKWAAIHNLMNPHKTIPVPRKPGSKPNGGQNRHKRGRSFGGKSRGGRPEGSGGRQFAAAGR
ncbi:MAG: DEAD/DEAH box helicase [Alphaproteobacteria bacterium]